MRILCKDHIAIVVKYAPFLLFFLLVNTLKLHLVYVLSVKA